MGGVSGRLYSQYWLTWAKREDILSWWEQNIKNGYPRSVIGADHDLHDFYVRRHGDMAKKKSAYTSGNGSWKGFANIDLKEADKAALRGLSPSADELFGCIDEVIRTGHKISVTRKADKPAVVVSFTGATDDCLNKGYTLSGFAASFAQAFMVCYYKHHYIAGGNWGQYVVDDDEDMG